MTITVTIQQGPFGKEPSHVQLTLTENLVSGRFKLASSSHELDTYHSHYTRPRN